MIENGSYSKLMMFIGAAVGGTIGWIGGAETSRDFKPISVISSEAVGAATDGKLEIRIVANYNDVGCYHEVDVFVFDDENKILFRKTGKGVTRGRPGRYDWRRIVDVGDIPPGNYQYQGRFNTWCKNGFFIEPIPNIAFRVSS